MLDLIKRYRVTVFAGVPTLYQGADAIRKAGSMGKILKREIKKRLVTIHS